VILDAPTGQQVVFGSTVPAVAVLGVSFDLTTHRFTIVYGPQGGGAPGSNKSVQGAIPAALQTALENHAQAAIENNEGWIAGTSSIATP